MHGIAESAENTVLLEDPVSAAVRNPAETPCVAIGRVSGAGPGPLQGCSPMGVA